MNYILSFLFCGLVCSLSQYVLEKSKLTPGHINTMLVILGCALSGLKIYDKLLEWFHSGCSVLIVNFGHLLVKSASEGFINEGLIGLFKGVLVNSSAGISVTIMCAFIISLLFRIKH